MEAYLKVQGRVVNGYIYHRVNVPSKISKKLNLKVGDKVRVRFIEVVDQDA